ncbi:MAG: DUF4157 domain-containing protein [Bacteroidia bacterium]|nr:DUF4157 domain-containing protein [Bacteroidia bacterium]
MKAFTPSPQSTPQVQGPVHPAPPEHQEASSFSLSDHPAAALQRKIQTAADSSPAISRQKSLQSLIGQSPAIQRAASFQAMADQHTSAAVVQRQTNTTGLPDTLKSGVENLSGLSMDDVKVHYNSGRPQTLQAHAYAQGTDIHLAPGQEKHLPHEAWHVVQQKQGRVRPTTQLKSQGIPLNDDQGLEREADRMGSKALHAGLSTPVQRVEATGQAPVVQRVLQDNQIPGLIGTINTLYGNGVNNIPDLVRQAWALGTTANVETMASASVTSVMTAFGLLDARVQMAAGNHLELQERLTDLSTKIWGRDEFAQKVISGLKAVVLQPTELAEALTQLPDFLPPVGWDAAGLASVQQVDAAGQKATLQLAQQGFNNEIDLLRIETAFLNYHPPGGLLTSPTPAYGARRGILTENLVAYGLPPVDYSTFQGTQLELDAMKRLEAQTREETKFNFKKDDVVFVGSKQTYGTEYAVSSQNQTYFIPKSKITLELAPVTGPLGGGNAVPLFNGGNPSPDDVGQQALGDCYLLASLASIAKSKPAFLKEMVKDLTNNDYAVRFYQKKPGGMGFLPSYIPKWIKITHEVHVDGNGDPIYAKGNQALWPGLVEKAFAVLQGSYETIGSGGDAGNALEIIMGRPSRSEAVGGGGQEGALGTNQYSQKAITLFKRIQSELGKGSLVVLGTSNWGTGGTGQSGGENTTLNPGMASTHAYSIFATKGDPQKNESLWVTVRNPWGRFGRKYERQGLFIKRTVASEQEGGTFDLELSDLMRFGDSLRFN